MFSNNIFSDLRSIAFDIQLRQNKQEKIWSFLSPDTVVQMPKSTDFGDDRFRISIIDQFNQCRPRLMNYRSLDDRDVAFAPSVILDSNASSYLAQYVASPERLNRFQRDAIRELILYLAQTNYDFNPFFYYIEAFAKDAQGKVKHHVVAVTEAIIRLQSMDEDLFRNSGKIEPRMVTFKKYAEKLHADTYAEMAVNQVEFALSHNPYPELENSYSAIYICLLKTALIQMQRGHDIQRKFVQMRSFMVSNLGVVMGRELYVALSYFSGLLDGFIPLQTGADFAKVRHRIRAAAWDILLLSFPDHFMAHGWPEPVTLAYICSGDKALQKLGRSTRIAAILCLEPHASSPVTLMHYDYEEIARKIGNDVLGELLLENERWQATRWMSQQSRQAQPKEDGLLAMIGNLEEEIRSICAM